MRYGIFADIHSNLEALEAILKAYQREAIDACYCVGDIVGYGANPKECVAKIREMRTICVAGNHDWAATEKIDTASFNHDAQEAVRWTSAQLEDAEKEYLRNLKLVESQHPFILAHGTLNEPELFHYPIEFYHLAHSFTVMKQRICFVGHSHIPRIYIESSDKRIRDHHALAVDIEDGVRYIINVGSVGQPRDGDPRAAYGIFDSTKKTFEIKRIDYDIKTAQDKIIRAGLPIRLASRLISGT